MSTETIRQLVDALGVLIKHDLKLRLQSTDRKPASLSEISRAIRDLSEIERQERQFDLFSYPDIQVEYVRPESGKTETETA